MVSIFFITLTFITASVANQNLNNSLNVFFTYFLPLYKNVSLPRNSNCKLLNNSTHNLIVCTCAQVCQYRFNTKDILPYISFNKPRFIVREMIQYAYFINNGENNFKINSKKCTLETCYPLVISYLTMPESPYYFVDIININETLME